METPLNLAIFSDNILEFDIYLSEFKNILEMIHKAKTQKELKFKLTFLFENTRHKHFKLGYSIGHMSIYDRTNNDKRIFVIHF